MKKKRVRLDASPSRAAEYANALERILRFASRGVPRIEFLTGISGIILESTGCDALELWLQDSDIRYRWELAVGPEPSSRFTVIGGPAEEPLESRECDAPAAPDRIVPSR